MGLVPPRGYEAVPLMEPMRADPGVFQRGAWVIRHLHIRRESTTGDNSANMLPGDLWDEDLRS